MASWCLPPPTALHRYARSSVEHVFIDLRNAELTPDDGEQLALLMTRCNKLTSIDVRGNDSMGERGANALVAFMDGAKVCRR